MSRAHRSDFLATIAGPHKFYQSMGQEDTIIRRLLATLDEPTGCRQS